MTNMTRLRTLPKYKSIWDKEEPRKSEDRSILDMPLKARFIEDENK